MDIATLTTLGGVVTSVASSIAAALAWGTKLQFSEEFKEARNAQVTVANQVVESIKVQRDAEIQQIRIEVEKKNVEIERLKAKNEYLEQNTIGAFKTKFDDIKATYASMIASFTSPSGNGIDVLKNKDLIEKKEIFELALNDLGESFNHLDYRQEARYWLRKNYKNLTEKAFSYVSNSRANTLTYCEGNEKERRLNQFYFDIEDYLELIGDCLVVDRPNLIDRMQPALPMSGAYNLAFKFIEQQIEGDIPKGAADEIKRYLNYVVISFKRMS